MMLWGQFGLATLAGLALGSFAVTAGIRFGRAESALVGRSRCDECGAQLSFVQTIPIISFLRSCGRCSHCRSTIDPLHPAAEIAGAVVAVSAALVGSWRGLLICGIGMLLITLSVTDLRTGRLPNPLTLSVAALAAMVAGLKSRQAFVAGVVAAALVLVLLAGLMVWRRRRGLDPGLGAGDVKLLAALALWLGTATPWLGIAAALTGLIGAAITQRLSGRLIFGPYIAAAGWAVGMVMEAHPWPTM